MKKYFLTKKEGVLKTSLTLACIVSFTVLVMTPTEHLNANNSNRNDAKNIDCTTGWRPVGGSCSCIANLCANYRTDRKYQFCGGVEIPTDEYRDVFTGFSIGCN